MLAGVATLARSGDHAAVDVLLLSLGGAGQGPRFLLLRTLLDDEICIRCSDLLVKFVGLRSDAV